MLMTVLIGDFDTIVQLIKYNNYERIGNNLDTKEIIIPELNNETIESMIYIIRGQKVMLDFELAKIYGYSTRDFNNQIKNNIERFDVDFRFQLTKIEWDDFLRCKISTANKRY